MSSNPSCGISMTHKVILFNFGNLAALRSPPSLLKGTPMSSVFMKSCFALEWRILPTLSVLALYSHFQAPEIILLASYLAYGCCGCYTILLTIEVLLASLEMRKFTLLRVAEWLDACRGAHLKIFFTTFRISSGMDVLNRTPFLARVKVHGLRSSRFTEATHNNPTPSQRVSWPILHRACLSTCIWASVFRGDVMEVLCRLLTLHKSTSPALASQREQSVFLGVRFFGFLEIPQYRWFFVARSSNSLRII